MTVSRRLVAGIATVALFVTGAVAWLQADAAERWTGGEPAVVLPASTTPGATPSPTATAEPTGPVAVFPRPHLPVDGGGAVPSEEKPSPARSNAPADSGGGEGASGRGAR